MQPTQRPLEMSEIGTSEVPQCTSTPIIQHIEQHVAAFGSEKQSFTELFQKIHSNEAVIRDLKQAILFHVEKKMEEIKSTL